MKLSKLEIDKIIIFIIFCSFIFWILSIENLVILKFPPDGFYYFKILPIYYWIGNIILLCLLFAVILKGYQINELIYLSILFILVLYNYGIPVFVYPTTKYIDAQFFSTIIERLIDPVPFSNIQISPMYFTEFQSSTIMYSMLSQICDIKAILFANYYPLYFMFLCLLLIHVISKTLLFEFFMIGPVAFLSAAWIQFDHICPQGHAFLLSLTLLLLIARSFTIGKTNGSPILMLLIWTCMVTSHALTPIINMFSILFVILIYYLVYYPNSKYPEFKDQIMSLSRPIVIFIVIYISYILYVSQFIFDRIIQTINFMINNIINEETFVLTDQMITENVTPSQSYLSIYYIRWAIIIIIVILGLANILYIIVFNKNNKKYISAYLIISLFLSHLILILILIGSGNNTYGFSKVYIFFSLSFSLLCSMVLGIDSENPIRHNRYLFFYKIMLSIVLLSALFMIPLTKYGGDPYQFISASEYAGGEFISKQESLQSGDFIYSQITNSGYNLIEMKAQQGYDYLNKFENQSMIYCSGQSSIYS